VAELKDLPRSILTMRETVANLKSLEQLLDPRTLKRLRTAAKLPDKFLKSLSGEYLSYHFGWKQLVRDVYDLLAKPEVIGRKIDRLIKRSGQATTYRKRKVLLSAGEGAPDFGYDWFYGELPLEQPIETKLSRKIQLDMVINTTFTFPGLNQPHFRSDLFAEKIGAYPRFTDIYNLVPWTWLVDWFTGLGNYVDIIDEVNHDRSLINYGFMTGKSTVQLLTNINLRSYSSNDVSFDNVWSSTSTKVVSNHSSVLELDLQFRKNLAGMMDVKYIAEPGSLTPYQQSILGALLGQRTRFTR
jgi:hypothetical protein